MCIALPRFSVHQNHSKIHTHSATAPALRYNNIAPTYDYSQVRKAYVTLRKPSSVLECFLPYFSFQKILSSTQEPSKAFLDMFLLNSFKVLYRTRVGVKSHAVKNSVIVTTAAVLLPFPLPQTFFRKYPFLSYCFYAFLRIVIQQQHTFSHTYCLRATTHTIYITPLPPFFIETAHTHICYKTNLQKYRNKQIPLFF